MQTNCGVVSGQTRPLILGMLLSDTVNNNLTCVGGENERIQWTYAEGERAPEGITLQPVLQLRHSGSILLSIIHSDRKTWGQKKKESR